MRDSLRGVFFLIMGVPWLDLDRNLNQGEYNMTTRPEILTKKDLFMWQAPSFNFDLNADEILAKALDVGFVTEVSQDQYIVNDNYISKHNRDV